MSVTITADTYCPNCDDLLVTKDRCDYCDWRRQRTDQDALTDRLRAWVEHHGDADHEPCPDCLRAIDALGAALDLADRMAVGIDGPNIVGRAFGTQLREAIATKIPMSDLTAELAEEE